VNDTGADQPSRLAVTVLIASFIALALYLAPAMVTVMINRLGFRPADTGYVISAELAGMGLATFPSLWWINRIHWGRLACLALLAVALGDAVSVAATTPLTLAIARFVSGLAQGTVSITCMSALRLTRNPNRSFGIWLFFELSVGAAALLGLPLLVSAAGIAGFYATLGAFALLLSAVALHIPSGHRGNPRAKPLASAGTRDFGAGIAGLGGILGFYIGFSAIWTFTSQMASPSLSAGEVARALSIAPIGGMLGAASAGIIGTRFGSARPFAVAVGALAAAAGALALRPEWGAYQVASCGVMLGWTFGVPFLFGAIAQIDVSGRLTSAINIVIGAGLAAGPALAALLVGPSGHYRRVVVLAISLSLASYLLAFPMLRASSRRAPQSL
jgi:predicted MFS family arabinose efflux permease